MRRVMEKNEVVASLDPTLQVVALIVPSFGTLEIDPVPLTTFRWTSDLISIVVQSSETEAPQGEGASPTKDLSSFDESHFFAPGSFLNDRCPSCGDCGLMILYPVVSRAFVERYAMVLGQTFSSRPSKGHGVRWQSDGVDLDAFRCEKCGSVFVNGPSRPGVFLEVPSEA